MRYEDVFQVEFAQQDDAWKVRLLLRKMGLLKHEKYCNLLLPKKSSDYNFETTVQMLTEMFGEQTSIFNVRYQCLKIAKIDAEDYVTYAGKVNRACENFNLKNLTADQFKSLIFI